MTAPRRTTSDLFSELPEELSAGLLAHAKPVNLATEANLFLAGEILDLDGFIGDS